MIPQLRAANPIQVENTKSGASDWVLTNPATNREIEGYASLTSVPRGGKISFFVNTADPSYTIDVFRIGWYAGIGARRMLPTITIAGLKQPMPTMDPNTGMVECQWTNPYVLSIPNNTSDASDWASGVYLAKLTGTTSGKQSYIIFVVRDDTRASAYIFQSSVTTFQAYNNWGGKSLYGWNSTAQILNTTGQNQAVKVSFNRPYALGANSGSASGVGAGDFITNVQLSSQTYPGGWEVNMVRFLESEGYDVTYITDLDTHENGSLLLNHKAFLSVGHDEYWSWQMRNNVETARDRGVGLAFFSANVCYWQIRFEPSVANGAIDRTIVSYKESAQTNDPLASSPTQSYLTTTNWREDPVNRPEAAMIGVQYGSNPANSDLVIVSPSDPVFMYTGLQSGSHVPGLVGYEYDQIQNSSPANLVQLAHSPAGSSASDMTIYTAASGAKVFATGSIQWSWGVDDFNTPALRPSVYSPAAQQITRNVLNLLTGLNPIPSFSLSVSPQSKIVAIGNATTYKITATTMGYNPALTFNVSGLPSGATYSLTGTGPWTLTISTSASTPRGNYPLIVTSSDGTQSRSYSVSLQVLNLIAQSSWKLLKVDSQELQCMNGAAKNTFDNNTATFWHTQWCPTVSALPHEIQIDLNGLYYVTDLLYLPRQDGGVNGRIGQYEIYVSSDGLNWGSAVATGTFANDANQKQVTFAPVTGRFVRLRALSEVNGNPYSSAAEINVAGNPVPVPRGTISSPIGNQTISTAQAINFTGSGSDPNNVPLTYRWTFGSGSGIPDSNLQNPGAVQFNTPGIYYTTLVVTNSNGLSDPMPPTRTITVGLIPYSALQVAYVDSQEVNCASDAASKAIDGLQSTFWHTQWCPSSTPTPHEIQIYLGGPYQVNNVLYVPRQDGSGNGRIGQYEVYTSYYGSNWGTPVATGAFANDATTKQVAFPPTNAQFIRLRALSEVNGNPWTSAAEISVLGAPLAVPRGTISSPSSSVSIPTGGSLTFTGAGADPNNLPLTYRWTFGVGSGIADSTLQNPGPVQFNNPGVYVVTLTVTNSQGVSDPTPATSTITVGLVPHTQWTLKYVDSQELSCGNNSAVLSFDNDAATFWHTQWCPSATPLPHEIQINLGAVYTLNAFAYLPRQDGSTYGRISQYELYVSADGINWGSAVATGTFANDASQKLVYFSSASGQYIRLRALSEVNGNPYASMAEINFFGR